MRKFLLAIIAVFSLVQSNNVFSQDASYEKLMIEEVVQKFFSGVTNYDVNLLRQAFDEGAQIFYIADSGKLTQITQWEWYDRIKTPTKTPERSNRIVSIDISGNAAMVKTESVFSKFKFVHYLSLMKTFGQWFIVNQIYHRFDFPPDEVQPAKQ